MIGLLYCQCFIVLALAQAISVAEDDPVTDFRVVYPQDGGVTTLPLRFKFSVDAVGFDALKARFGAAFVCVELEGVAAKCSPMLQLKIEFQDLPETSYVARAFISDSVERYHETGPVSFSLLSGHDFDAYVVSQREQIRVGHGFPRDLNALQWAQQQQSETSNIGSGGSINHTADPHSDEVQLLIGVKTAVLRNFAQRQAIRDTWAKKTDLPPNVRVFFLGCTPVILDHLNRQRNLDAVNLERAVYQDLLTDELQCDDKYTLLTEKVSAFFQWLVAEFPRTKAVMITDDDVYVRVDQLVADLSKIEQRKGLYIGELSDTLHPDPLAPVRDPTWTYYTSKQSYPLKHFPPYAGGPHYLLSMDCVRFIAKNRQRLASLSGLEDTSVALWLLAIQVHVQYSPALASLRLHVCRNHVLSYADLSPLGIRSIHDNLLRGREFCHNFDRILWGCTSIYRTGTPLYSLGSDSI